MRAARIERHASLIFVALACALSWTLAWLALDPRIGASGGLQVVLDHAAKFGPSLAALITAALVGGRDALRALLARLARWRVGWGWYALACLGPLALWATAATFRFGATGGWPPIEPAAALVFVPLMLRHVFVGGGLGEELGWRGFLLPRLQARQGALRASLVVGLAWGLWHLPAFYLPGTGKQGSPVDMALFTLLTVVLSVIFTWVFRRTGGSVLLLSLLHGAMNAGENTLKTVVPDLRGDTPTALIYGGMLLGLAALAARGLHRDGRNPAV